MEGKDGQSITILFSIPFWSHHYLMWYSFIEDHMRFHANLSGQDS